MNAFRILLVCSACLLAGSNWQTAFANDEVRQIDSSGVLYGQSGQRYSLAGIDPAPEAHRILEVLLKNKEIEFTEAGGNSSQDVLQGFVFVKTSNMSFPFKDAGSIRRDRVMVNELLLEMGAATVRDSIPFKELDRFRQIENQAKSRGEGVWSYDDPLPGGTPDS